MSFCPDIYEDFFDTETVKSVPPKKEDQKCEKPWTLCIKTIYGNTYEVNNVFDYGYNANAKHYWYTTMDNKSRDNYIRADRLFYFGLKEYCIKEVKNEN